MSRVICGYITYFGSYTVTLAIQSHGGISSSKADHLYTGFGVEQNINQRLSSSKGAVVQIFLKT